MPVDVQLDTLALLCLLQEGGESLGLGSIGRLTSPEVLSTRVG